MDFQRGSYSQGCVLCLNIYMNDLVTNLEATGVGVCIVKSIIACSLYVDNLVLLLKLTYKCYWIRCKNGAAGCL